MGIKVLLSLGLFVFLLYGTVQRQQSRFVFVATALVGGAGLLFVWAPELANDLARALGVGRGADLVLYCWVVTGLIVGINLHILLRANLRLTTEIARHVALSQPLRRDAKDSAAESRLPQQNPAGT